MSDESDLLAELRALGRATDQTSFAVSRDGVRIDVVYAGGSSCTLTFKAFYDTFAKPGAAEPGYRDVTPGVLPAARPLKILLRPENLWDTNAKRDGVSVEFQTGDEEFDRRIYVETDTDDRRVLGAVLNAEVRAAVLALFETGFRRVCIDDDGEVNALLVEFARNKPTKGRGERAVDAFARLLRNLPALKHVDAAPRPGVPFRGLTLLLGAIGVLGWGTNIGYVGGVVGAFRMFTNRRSEPSILLALGAIAVGIVAGIAAANAYSGAVRERVRGRSNAHGLIMTAKFCAFGGASVIVFTATLILAMQLSGP